MTKEQILKTKIIIVPNEDAWFVQGLEVDYFASGLTRQEALENFERGLELIIKLNQEKFGNLDDIKSRSLGHIVDDLLEN